MVKTIKNIFISSLVIVILMFGLSFADSNGIWNYAKDLRPGTFGSDELDSNSYIFVNPLIADNFDVNKINATNINSENIYTVKLNASKIDSIEIYKNGNDVATLDATGKVPLTQLPFHKGDLISPTDRPLISGLTGYDTDYFSIANLGISGNSASNVREGVVFGPGSEFTGTLDDDVICTTAGGNANCGATSVINPGTFYAMVGTNSVTNTNYCTKIVVNSDGSITSTNIKSAGICSYISSCDSSSQSSSFYPDGTSCGGSNVCMLGGACLNPVTLYDSPGSYTYTVPAGITSIRLTSVGGGGGGGRAADSIGSGQAGGNGGNTVVSGIIISYGGKGGESYDIGSEPEYGGSNGGARGALPTVSSGTLISSGSATRGSDGTYEGGNGKGGSNSYGPSANLETDGAACGLGGGGDLTSGYKGGGGGASRASIVDITVTSGQVIIFTVGAGGSDGGNAGRGAAGCVEFKISG